MIFRKWGGAVKGRLELFRNDIRFGGGTTVHCTEENGHLILRCPCGLCCPLCPPVAEEFVRFFQQQQKMEMSTAVARSWPIFKLRRRQIFIWNTAALVFWSNKPTLAFAHISHQSNILWELTKIRSQRDHFDFGEMHFLFGNCQEGHF